MSRIAEVTAHWVLDSRAMPTVEVEATLDDGRTVFAQAPSGASTGRHESLELRDGDATRFNGHGVERATANVRTLIGPALVGADPQNLGAIDELLVELDGTDTRENLGANAMLATSAACAKAGALVTGQELWQFLAGDRAATIPLPMINLFSGNLHAAGGMSIQDVLVVPYGADSVAQALEWIDDIYLTTRSILRSEKRSTLVGDEGGYGAPTPSSEATIAFATRAIESAGYSPGRDVGIALDIASTHMLQADGRYVLDGTTLTSSELIAVLDDWRSRFPIVSIEDPLGEDDWAGWHEASNTFGATLQLLGDDLICTHMERLERAFSEGCANAVLVKANQIGTLSEALAVADRARELGMRAVVSARSGETEDDWLADLATASGAGQIKVGSVARSERLSKYNRLLRIERSKNAPPWSGANGFG